MDDRFWISMSSNGHFRTLNVQPRYGNGKRYDKEESHWINNIYFQTRDDADAFLLKLKNFIKDNYPGASDWFPETDKE